MLKPPMNEKRWAVEAIHNQSKELSQNCHNARWQANEGVCNFLILWWPLEDSNFQPKDYESSALPLS